MKLNPSSSRMVLSVPLRILSQFNCSIRTCFYTNLARFGESLIQGSMDCLKSAIIKELDNLIDIDTLKNYRPVSNKLVKHILQKILWILEWHKVLFLAPSSLTSNMQNVAYSVEGFDDHHQLRKQFNLVRQVSALGGNLNKSFQEIESWMNGFFFEIKFK